MSATYVARLVVGVLASDVFRVEAETGQETKFDPDTGKPYARVVTVYRPFLFGQEMPTFFEPSPEEWGLKKHGLESFSTGYGSYRDTGWGDKPASPFHRYDYGEYVIGRAVIDRKTGDDFPGIVPTDLDELTGEVARVTKILKALGCGLRPKVYLVRYCG